nr:methyl-accepting chemotaxis protein [Salinibacter altiplanensis]
MRHPLKRQTWARPPWLRPFIGPKRSLNLSPTGPSDQPPCAERGQSGTTGQGFAVVAEEIRELAGQADEATRDITQAISKLRDASDDARQLVHQFRLATTGRSGGDTEERVPATAQQSSRGDGVPLR